MVWVMPCPWYRLKTKAARTTSNNISDHAPDYCHLRRSPPAMPRVNAGARARNLLQDWREQSLARPTHRRVNLQDRPCLAPQLSFFSASATSTLDRSTPICLLPFAGIRPMLTETSNAGFITRAGTRRSLAYLSGAQRFTASSLRPHGIHPVSLIIGCFE